ncbi:MAG: GNAT family N-acetyltransferase [Planctomycetota bacterium]
MPNTTTAAQAVQCVRSGDHLFIGSGCAEPQSLVRALVARSAELRDVEIFHLLTRGDAPYVDAAYEKSFRHNAFFIGANVREAVRDGRADYTPIFLSEIPSLFYKGRLRVDVALIQVSPPDRHGFCSLGISVDVVKAAVARARVVIAEVNPRMPRTLGDSFIAANRIDALVEVDEPVLELPPSRIDEVSDRIGLLAASLVEDGATLQMGIGTIPDAALCHLGDRDDLGVHTEMFSDGLLALIESGAVTGRRKTLLPGKVVSSFCMGTKRLYEYIHDNPFFEFRPSEFTNDPFTIARNEKMVAINSALQVDLTGQVCADSLGTRFFSGIGGQVDFIRGAARSPGGKPIIALPSTAKDGTVSRIAPVLDEGAGVVTTRGDVHYVVTEHGIADLHGRTVRERALALISIAHPDFRGELLAAARKRRCVYVDQLPLPEEARPYPLELERSMDVAGSAVRLRPIGPVDERLMRDLLYSRSEGIYYPRLGKPVARLERDAIQQLCTADYDQQMSIGAFAGAAGADAMVGIGRYDVDRSTRMAEIVVLVREDYQGKGIAGALLDQLTKAAESRGILGFHARARETDLQLIGFLQKRCSPVQVEVEGGLARLTWHFEEVRRLRESRREKTFRRERETRPRVQ